MVLKRILGLIMLMTALAIVAFSLAAAVYVGQVLAEVGDSIQDNLALVSNSLDTARDTLALSRDTFGDVGGGLGTAVEATANAARTVLDSRPLIDNVSTVTTKEVPEAIEGIQNTLPNMIQVAGVIDRALRTLGSVGIDRTIPLPFGGSIPLQFDLGIDYAPVTAFDASLRGFQTSLDGLPESLRGLETDLQTTSDNLGMLSSDLQATSDNLALINNRVGEVLPLIDQYTVLVDDLSVTIARVSADLDQQLDTLRLGILAGLVFLGLSQLAPLYLGWELLSGRRAATERGVAAAPDTVVLTSAETPKPVAILPLPEPTQLPPEEWSPLDVPEDNDRT